MGFILSGLHRAKDLGIKTERSAIYNDLYMESLRMGPRKISKMVRFVCPSLGLLSHLLSSYYNDLHLHRSL